MNFLEGLLVMRKGTESRMCDEFCEVLVMRVEECTPNEKKV
jgi:hypothetical protein